MSGIASRVPPVTVCRMTMTNNTLDIGYDLDGVGYGWWQSLAGFIHRRTGRQLDTMQAPKTWNFPMNEWGLTLKEFLDHFHAGVDARYIFRVGEPLPGFVEGINRLHDAGHRIHLVTDRATMGSPGVAEYSTRAWLTEYAVKYTSLTFSADKTSVHTDTFIEDKPENYLALRAAGVDAFLRDHPYNAHVDTPPGRRVPTAAEYADALLEMAQAAA